MDKATREVTLQRPDGTHVVVLAGPEVRNFDQIEVGDTVTARYAESISARQLGPNEVAQDPEVLVAAGAAEAGARPAATIGAGLALTVTVENIDYNDNLIVFTDPSGALHAVRPSTGTGKTFIKKLKVGDRVDAATIPPGVGGGVGGVHTHRVMVWQPCDAAAHPRGGGRLQPE